MRNLSLKEAALPDLAYWALHQPKLLKRIFELFADMVQNPFSGIGKPEPLKRNLQGYWSRRINDEHRILYQVTDDAVIVVACRSHYESV